MPFKPGHKGGRPKGKKNKLRSLVQEKAEDLGIDPFEILLFFAKGDWESLGYESKTYTRISGNNTANEEYYIDASIRSKAAAEACQYLYPKLKAIDHSGTIDTGDGEKKTEIHIVTLPRNGFESPQSKA